MRRRKKKLMAAALTGGLACVGAQHADAETILTGLSDTNTDVPADHGSNAPGTPNVALTWGSVPAGNWDQYADWPNDPGGGVYQVDGANDGSQTHTVAFAPDSGWDVILTSLDLNVWSGGGATDVDWSVGGSSSGNLGSGTFSTPDATAATHDINLTGSGGETLTLSLVQTSGAGSYLAMDNLTFDQAVIPEPSTLALALAGMGGLGALAIRRKRK